MCVSIIFVQTATILAGPSTLANPGDIAASRDAFREFLRMRGSSGPFNMHTQAEVQLNLHFLNAGPSQIPGLIVMKLDANGGDKTDPVEPRWVNERMRKDEQTEPAHRGTEGGIGSVTSAGFLNSAQPKRTTLPNARKTRSRSASPANSMRTSKISSSNATRKSSKSPKEYAN
jgi:alpha-1,6-glucosidase-like protein